MSKPLLCRLGIHRPYKCDWIFGTHYPIHKCLRCFYTWRSRGEHRREITDFVPDPGIAKQLGWLRDMRRAGLITQERYEHELTELSLR